MQEKSTRRLRSGTFVCEVCQQVFTLSRIKPGTGRFCSRTCSNASKDHRKASPADRLWRRVDKTETCWIWLGGIGIGGYGRIETNQDGTYAHILAWSLASGHWPVDGEIVGHACDTPPCVRNDDAGLYTVRGIDYPRLGHLWLGTQMANVHDSMDKGRRPVSLARTG